ncbi:MAG: transposase, partial [Oleiphilaceae bacterium]
MEPYQYYVNVLEAIPCCEKVEDYEALLPWNI